MCQAVPCAPPVRGVPFRTHGNRPGPYTHLSGLRRRRYNGELTSAVNSIIDTARFRVATGPIMLFEFIVLNREEIVARTRTKVRGRPWPSVSDQEIEHGVPLFLTQLAETLRLETTAESFPSDAVGATATRHGAELLALGFNVAQVVHDYGDICQAITEMAIEQHAPITVEEFHTLNRCLDTAIAEAVTEHTRLTALKQ
jgi:hypothetical protein